MSTFTKQALLKMALEEGLTHIQINPKHPSVIIPEALKAAPAGIVLKLSYRYPQSDITFDDDGVSATLSFADPGRFRCVLPWDAIESVVTPGEEALIIFPQKEAPPAVAAGAENAVTAKRPSHLRLVKDSD